MRIDVYTRLDTEFAICRDLRTRIFVEELDIPLSSERDDRDYGAAHYLIRLKSDDSPIGVCRSYIQGDSCIVERFGLLPEYRGFNLARKALGIVLEDCLERYPFMPITTHAPQQCEDIFADFGFVDDGERFISAGISYRPMIMKPPTIESQVFSDLLMTG